MSSADSSGLRVVSSGGKCGAGPVAAKSGRGAAMVRAAVSRALIAARRSIARCSLQRSSIKLEFSRPLVARQHPPVACAYSGERVLPFRSRGWEAGRHRNPLWVPSRPHSFLRLMLRERIVNALSRFGMALEPMTMPMRTNPNDCGDRKLAK
jgi:hypothetical protein